MSIQDKSVLTVVECLKYDIQSVVATDFTTIQKMSIIIKNCHEARTNLEILSTEPVDQEALQMENGSLLHTSRAVVKEDRGGPD
jgi:uncharacterized protein YbbC (DUF1343 family)